MIAYNKNWLDHLATMELLEAAFYANTISKEEKEKADLLFPVGFYSPNIYIRAGLFLLTIIIGLFSFGLLSLIFLSNIEKSIGGLILLFGFCCYAVLELFIAARHHYKSGVDDALLWISGICIIASANLLGDISIALNCILAFVLATYFFLRFSDMLMAAVAGIALLGVVFFYYIKAGEIAKATAPFLLMTVSAIVYFLIKKYAKEKYFRFYSHCAMMLKIVMLTGFYAAGNYYVVRVLSSSMFGLSTSDSIPFGWLFWIFTFIVPFIYILWGLHKKESILLRVGLLLIAVLVFTFRYYHALLPVETAMALGGIVLMSISYLVTKYLHQPRNGFTASETADKFITDKLNIESLIIAETFSGTDTKPGTKFGGGGFGGAGASGDF